MAGRKTASEKTVRDIGLARAEFEAIADEYRRLCALETMAIDPEGRTVFGEARCGIASHQPEACRQARELALRESLRWGEATIESCPGGRLIWAVPVLRNQQLLGGILAAVGEQDVFGEETGSAVLDLRRCGALLRQILERRNLTNETLLEHRRRRYRHEQIRAEAIHSIKRRPHFNLHMMYLREEPVLMAALRQGDLRAARGHLNTLLASISVHAGRDLELTKSYFMELIVTIFRNAVEIGGNAPELLGANYAQIVELSRITSEEALAAWLHDTLERILQALHHSARHSPPAMVAAALHYMEQHLGEVITRDDVAAAVNMSPTHFSRVFSRYAGETFIRQLNRMRVDQSAELLARTDKSLVLIALETGFRNQSYFTKVFRHYKGIPPGEYRKRYRRRRGEGASVPSGSATRAGAG